jgi:hypothetical protein
MMTEPLQIPCEGMSMLLRRFAKGVTDVLQAPDGNLTPRIGPLGVEQT